MMVAHSVLATQLEFYDVQILQGDEMPRRLMTVPALGPATALPRHDHDPKRFKNPSDVGGYLGLAPCRKSVALNEWDQSRIAEIADQALLSRQVAAVPRWRRRARHAC
jgi:hypothetical protein